MPKQGEIVLIPIPFSNLQSIKKRPVLIISNDYYNELTGDIIVLAITSNLNEKKYSIEITDDNLDEGQLKIKSCIRCDKIYTLSQEIIVSKFGIVSHDIMEKVRSKISELIK
ncbi:type II toxin-antitoxin system PemK/MazF family toxin [Syntrophomonas wolfei]|uniref:type II toxin-antitoxin system PemK/MazF family toxin n=1 Tax=Syntrophomonas wolfei TaxID=863 RepID=UPI00077379CB|nr:type II toxin-antitoxin system PemK/MazF family toxin [Syntrophomonas wolfei]